MGFQISPGVQVKEVDLTNVIPAVSTSIGAFAGHFSWGPVDEVGLVSSEKELIEAYGTPVDTTNGGQYDNYTSFLQAASFLKYGNTLRVSRACASSADGARNSAGGIYQSQTSNVLIKNKETFDGLSVFGGEAGVIQGRYPGKMGDSLKAYIATPLLDPDGGGSQSAGNFSLSTLDGQVNGAASTTAWAATNETLGYNPSASPLVDVAANDEIHVAVVDEDGLFTGVPGTVLEIFEGLSLYSDARKDGGSNFYKTVINRDSEYIYINQAALKSIFSATVSGVDYALPGDAGSATKIFNSVQLSSNRISTFTFTPASPHFDSPADAKPGTYTVKTGQSGVTQTGTGKGAEFEIAIGASSSAELPITVTLKNGGGGFAVGDTVTISETLLGSANAGSPDNNIVITISALNNTYLFDYSLHGGADGTDADKAAQKSDVVTALSQFDNPVEIDVNLVFAEADDAGAKLIANDIINLTGTTRKDCVGFLSPNVASDTSAEVIADLSYNNSYVAMDSSAVYVYNKFNDTYRYIPANGHIAGLCARTDDTNDAWFSPAGYNRGNLLGVTKLKWNPSKSERDALYKAGVNPIISEPGQGILLFGDKTAQSKPSAFDRINVRRLFIVLEKAISTASKFQLFELNDEFTRAMFRNMTEPFLRDVKGRRGITDFLVVCDETNNTGDVIDTNRFVADIYIKPARSINFITLNFIATRTGVEFSEIVGTGN
tara:strand:+ start:6062 stop:8215 length:2154 start_codon:yes stop_codon:yes gene_type:complete